MKPKVKICGITNIEDALYSLWSDADILGFVFFKNSRRYIEPRIAKDIIEILPPFIFKVGLFVNESVSRVKSIAKYCRLDFVQLHGDEDRTYLKKLKGLRLIKAVRIKGKDSFKGIEDFPCELLLFDNYSESGFGGSGKTFDWNLAKEIKRVKKPYIVSGGLTCSNVKKAVQKFSPYAVDVSSGVENKPEKKDKLLIKEFIKNAKR